MKPNCVTRSGWGEAKPKRSMKSSKHSHIETICGKEKIIVNCNLAEKNVRSISKNKNIV